MTDDSAFKKQVRAKMTETGEKYTVARRMVIAGRDPGQPPVTSRRRGPRQRAGTVRAPAGLWTELTFRGRTGLA